MSIEDTASDPAPDRAGSEGDRPVASMRRARTTGRVRIEDVARAAGVSSQTVSRFFREPVRVGAASAARIREAVAATGYVPNLVAGSLASNRSRVIAILVPTIANPVHAAPVEGASDVLRAAGYQVLLGSTGYDPSREAELVRAFIGRRVDGLIVTGGGPETRRLAHAIRLPVVQLWELPQDPIDMAVGFCNRSGGAAIAGHFAARGHRRLAVIGHSAIADTRSAARVVGFVEAARARGLASPAVVTIDGPMTVGSGEPALACLLDRAPACDAVFAVSDQIAIGMVLACRRRGIEVPADLAIAGFGDADIAARLTPALTTVRVDRERLGAEAGRLLLARLADGETDPSTRDIGFELVVRASS